MVAKGWEGRRDYRGGDGYSVSFGGAEYVLKLMVVMNLQLCEYTQSHLSESIV